MRILSQSPPSRRVLLETCPTSLSHTSSIKWQFSWTLTRRPWGCSHPTTALLSIATYVEQMLDDLPICTHQPRQQAGCPQPSKRAEFDDLPEEEETTELESYQQLKVSLSAPKIPLLQWWKEHAKELPALSSVAHKVLAVNATSSASERNFSVARFVVNKRRTNLNPETVDNILSGCLCYVCECYVCLVMLNDHAHKLMHVDQWQQVKTQQDEGGAGSCA